MRLNLVRLFVCVCALSGDYFVLFWDWEFQGVILYRVVVVARARGAGASSGIRASRFGLGFSEDSEGSRSDPVEIVLISDQRYWCSWDRVSISGGR